MFCDLTLRCRLVKPATEVSCPVVSHDTAGTYNQIGSELNTHAHPQRTIISRICPGPSLLTQTVIKKPFLARHQNQVSDPLLHRFESVVFLASCQHEPFKVAKAV